MQGFESHLDGKLKTVVNNVEIRDLQTFIYESSIRVFTSVKRTSSTACVALTQVIDCSGLATSTDLRRNSYIELNKRTQ